MFLDKCMVGSDTKVSDPCNMDVNMHAIVVDILKTSCVDPFIVRQPDCISWLLTFILLE